MAWKEVTEERYYEMLDLLPPAIFLYYGFLVGEPWTERQCSRRTHLTLPAFQPFVFRDGRYYEGDAPLTVPEFKFLDLSTVVASEPA